jgi:4-hydroxy-tetrahydrodipicolinate synthase
VAVKSSLKLTGSMTALVTPFKGGKVDLDAFVRHVEHQIEHGTSVLVPCGTTGESATMDHEEQLAVVKACVKTARGRVPVIAGSGKNDTRATIALTTDVKEAGADAALVVTPYYNKPSQEGLVRHYQAVADAVDIPVVLYNVPGRTGINLLPESVARLAEHRRIVANKEASGDLVQIAEIVRLCGANMTIISGDDGLTFPMIAIGATGVISVASNVAPAEVAKLCKAALANDIAAARAQHLRLLPLFRVLFAEASPGPTKYALAKMGRMENELRLPMAPTSEPVCRKVDDVLKELALA